MINLLPPQIKSELAYSRRNALLVRYIKITVVVFALSGGGLLGGQYYLHQRIHTLSTSLSDNQVRISQYGPMVQNATLLSQRVKAIESIQHNQAHFSQLLQDLSQYMPTGTALASIGLTGDDAKPVALVVYATSYDTAVAFRDALIKSKRVGAADIGTIKPNTASSRYPFEVDVTFSFSKGAAK